MANIDTTKIAAALKGKTEGLTATALAQAVGFSKASSIKDKLAELVKDGTLEIDSSGRYEIYKLKTSISKKSSSDEKVTVVDGEKISTKLPEASSHDLQGYKVETVSVDGKVMKKITRPDGKKIRMEQDEKLLVINNEPKYVVKTAEDVITCIRKYAMDTGLTVFSVDDIRQNRKISNDKDVAIKDDHIMFMNIKKHNKAA